MIGKLAFDVAMAHRIADQEKARALTLGHDVIGAMLQSWQAFDDALRIASAPDKPAVWPRGAGPVSPALREDKL
jgi:hypothetical protein